MLSMVIKSIRLTVVNDFVLHSLAHAAHPIFLCRCHAIFPVARGRFTHIAAFPRKVDLAV